MPQEHPTRVREWHAVSPEVFRDEILDGDQPALLRDVVSHWPAVRAGRESREALTNYLLGFDGEVVAETMLGPPGIGGRFFYNDDLTGLNFQRRPQTLAQSLRQLRDIENEPAPPAVYLGAMPLAGSLAGFARENTLPLLDPRVVPRLWLGNRVTVQTHYDLSLNVACVIAGRRRFTLFPPDQLVNLYVGPLEFTLAGQPISMVRLDAPDHERFPRFREALRQAQVAELGPGDALFIPYMWWHHVESLDTFNALVNYWWDDSPAFTGSPFEALMHALMSVRTLPPRKRAIWEKVFAHHVFGEGEAVGHLAPERRGVQGEIDARMSAQMREWLLRVLHSRRR